MPSLVLSTKGEYLNFSVFNLNTESEEVLRILSHAINSRVTQASRPAIILTGSYNINNWVLPRNLLLHVATQRIQTMVNKGIISLQPINADIPTTNMVANVQNPNPFLTQLMGAKTPYNNINKYVASINNKLKQGQLCINHIAQGQPAHLFLNTNNVTLGPKYTKVFSANICKIIKI